MARKPKKGWFGDSEGHARAARASHEQGTKWKWLSLLMVPLFFVVGWLSNQYVSDIRTDVYSPGLQYGIGGGPPVPCSVNPPASQ